MARTTTIDVEILRVFTAGVEVMDGRGTTAVLPLSELVDVDERKLNRLEGTGDSMEIEIPEWLANDRGLE